MNIYISSSWKNREKVRECAGLLRRAGHTVYDFTDPSCRKGVPEIPPEMFPEQFDPEKHEYVAYLDRPEWIDAVNANREALDECDAVVLLLPCGNDAHADWAYAVGRGKRSIIVGHPPAGERTPTHWWADEIVGSIETARDVINRWENWANTSCPYPEIQQQYDALVTGIGKLPGKVRRLRFSHPTHEESWFNRGLERASERLKDWIEELTK